MSKLMPSVEAALSDLQDGHRVMVSGFGGAGTPHDLMKGLDRIGARGLTLIINSLRHLHTAAPSLFAEGRVVHAVCSAARGRGRDPAPYEAQAEAGTLNVEVVPQGTFAERIRAGGAGIPAFYVPAGVGTGLARGKETREFEGVEYVLEHALNADFAFLRGATADLLGNVSFRGTQANFGPAMASAARIAVVEVDRISVDPLPTERIDLSGIFVQRIVHSPRVEFEGDGHDA